MKNQEEAGLLEKAKNELAADMKEREIAAILWDNGQAGFHFIPEITVPTEKGERTVRVTGLYSHDGNLYALEEGFPRFELKHFFTEGIDVPPVVVTLTEDMAADILGTPSEKEGFTQSGNMQEWLTIADCYFEALNER